MRLKRLEVRGFKTFASPVTLAFDSPITAIVGPNGSGKSNLADAVRWALGEQSARSLRTKRTEDVIFAGGSGRAQLGMAEVAVTLDNEDGWLDVPYAEVCLMRRAFRSGENEYFVNGNRVRLRDLTDLVLKANAGPASVVIGQGLVDLALSMRPEERRFLFEEAADVKRHALKVKEAQDKLAATEINMRRLADLAAELAPRVAALERQAERARRHATLAAELRGLMLRWYRHQWRKGQIELAAAEVAERQAAAALEALAAELAQAAASATALAERRQQLLTTARDVADQAAATAQTLAQAQLAVAVARERRTALAARLEEIASRLRELAASEARTISQLEALRNERGVAVANCERLALTVEHLSSALLERERRHHSHTRAVTAAEGEIERLTEAWAQTRAAVARLAEGLVSAEREREGRRRAAEENEARLGELAREGLAGMQQAQQLTAEAQAAGEALAGAEKAVLAAERALTRTETDADALRRERHGLQARHAALARWQQDLTGYHAGVRAVLQAARAPRAQRLSGIVGVVAELLRVPPDYEVAVEVALGGRLQDVVVERWEDAEAAIDLLKQNRAGRATFLPLDTLRGGTAAANPFNDPGVLGVASDLVGYEPAHAVVARHLLGRTLIVQDLAVARRALRNCPAGWQIVTLSGEVVRSSGAVTGGVAGQQQGGLLAQEREWRDLPARIEGLAGQLAAAERAANEAREELRQLRAAVDQARRRERDLVAARQRVEGDLAVVRRESERAKRNLAQATAALDAAAEACAGQRTGRERAEAELAQLVRAREAARVNIEAARGALAAVQAEDGDASHQLSTAKVDLAAAEREESRLGRELADRERDLLEARGASDTLRDEETRLREQLAALVAAVAEGESEGALLATRQETLLARESDLQSVIAKADADLSAIEETRRALYERQSELGANHAAAQAAVQRTGADLASLRERIGGDLAEGPDGTAQLRLPWEHGQDEVTDVDEVNPEQLRRQIDHLRAQLRSLSAVNPDAVRDYEELSGRHRFLTAQHADLQQAARTLRQAIADLEQSMARQFERTFAQVATEFRRAFTALFGGGTARLTLTQPDSILETGIEIIAQPPGKRWQSLALLSGGERALTAVALLFAILKVKPSPFCVLDEVDAALDDANIVRTADMLASLSAQTQFVVVTHNKGTMQAAGALYGVTMAQDGVSRIVSLRLADLPPDDEPLPVGAGEMGLRS